MWRLKIRKLVAVGICPGNFKQRFRPFDPLQREFATGKEPEPLATARLNHDVRYPGLTVGRLIANTGRRLDGLTEEIVFFFNGFTGIDSKPDLNLDFRIGLIVGKDALQQFELIRRPPKGHR